MRITLITLSILLAFQLPMRGQGADSLQLRLKNATTPAEKATALSLISFDVSHSHPDSALALAKAGFAMLDPKKSTKPLGDCYNSIGWAFFELGKMDSAEYDFLRAVAVFTDIGDKEAEAKTLANLGDIYESQKNYKKALQSLLKAMDLLAATNDNFSKAYVEKLIGTIYDKEGFHDQAKSYLSAAIENFKTLHKWGNMAGAQMSLANIYIRVSKFDSALIYYRAALNTNNLAKDLVNAAYIYENIGNAYATMQEQGKGAITDSPLIYYQLAYHIFQKLGSQQDEAYEKFKIGNALSTRKRYKEAQIYLEEALKTFDTLHAVNYSYDVATELSELYNREHDYQKAYIYLQKADVYSDTLSERNKNELVADLLVKYESEKKDRSIAQLRTQQILAEHKLSRIRIIESFSIALALLIIALGLTLANRYRVKQKLKELQLRNQISSDLHDDIGSSLSSILLLSKMATSSTPNQPELIHKISSNAQEVIERVSDIVWTTNPKYDAGENLREKIENYILQVRQMSNVSITGNISDEIMNIKFPTEIRRNIFLIIKEAINNILKHAGATEIIISLKAEQKKIDIIIEDNGVGFNVGASNKGNGLETMQLRAKNIGGLLSIHSEPGRGTRIVAKIPLPNSRYSLSF